MPEIRTSDQLEFVIHGDPKPQGSKKAMMPPNARFPVVIESAGEKLKQWRYAVANKAAEMMGEEQPWDGPISLVVTFNMIRPKGHFGTGRNAGILKESSPEHHTKKPDTDKLIRAVMDSLSKRVYRDDSQVVNLTVFKRYCETSSNAHVNVSKVVD